jgi:hypothetical protein
MSEPSVHEPKRAGLGTGGWLAIAAMAIVLVMAVWFMFYAWNSTDAQISIHGYIALVLGIVFTTLVGGGLMALMFYSSRKGYDR